MKAAITILGCDQYPNSPLAGCLADANRIRALFAKHGWEGPPNVAANDQVTSGNIRGKLMPWFLQSAAVHKHGLWFASGHGSKRPTSRQGDPDEEFYCPYNIDELWSSPELPTDAYYEAELAKLPADGTFWAWFACCNSGGMTTTQIDDAAAAVMKAENPASRVRYLRGPFEELWAKERKSVSVKAYRRDADNVFVDDASPYGTIAAARSDQYSYEVTSSIHGSFDVSVFFFCELLNEFPDWSVRRIHSQVIQKIQDVYQFDQTPQLWGPKRLIDSPMFDSYKGNQVQGIA